ESSEPSPPRCVDGGSIRYHCLWSGCANIYEKADDLYDHVIELHINPLHDLTPETSKAKQEKEDDESIKCKWDDCTMFLRRGDNEKKISWLMDHYRTRHARSANPFHCVIEGCQMRFSTTYRLEEHVRVEHINPPKPGPRPTLHCPHFDEKLLKCVRFMNKHSFKVAFNPVDPNAGLRGAKRRKSIHRYAYKIVPSESLPPKLERQTNVNIFSLITIALRGDKAMKSSLYDVESVRGLSIFDLFPRVGADGESTEPSTRNIDA
ncbi:zinc finger, C2H2 type, partial [Ancylostoma duodenale]